jgi:hypothetical protein
LFFDVEGPMTNAQRKFWKTCTRRWCEIIDWGHRFADKTTVMGWPAVPFWARG